MAQALRQALCRTRGVLSLVNQAWTPPHAAVQLESRALTSLLSFRGFRQQPWASQGAVPGPSSQQADGTSAPLPASPLPPWTPTRELQKRKFLPKRMQHLLTVSQGGCSCQNALPATTNLLITGVAPYPARLLHASWNYPSPCRHLRMSARLRWRESCSGLTLARAI